MAGPVFEDMSNRPAKEGGFSKLPHWVLRESNLTLHETAVYMALIGRSDATGHAWPSHRLIAIEAKLSESAAKRALKSLERRGRITKTVRPKGDGTNHSNMYYVKPFEKVAPPELTAKGGVLTEPPRGSDRTPPGVCEDWEEQPPEVEPIEEDSRSNLTVGRDDSFSGSDSGWPMPAATKKQLALLSDMFIHYTAEEPNTRTKAEWERLDIEQAKRLIAEYLAKVPRYDAYEGPELGEPAYAALSQTGKAWAEATMLPDLLWDVPV
jgi:hypothetical protein